jgi:hypothetical protein
MTGVRAAALLFASLSAILAVFELALAAGAPWGEYAMGGAFPGAYPPPMRWAAAVQAAAVSGFALVILSRGGLLLAALRPASRWLAWGVAAFMAIAVTLNLITPSEGERLVWAPVAGLMFLSSLWVARGR